MAKERWDKDPLRPTHSLAHHGGRCGRRDVACLFLRRGSLGRPHHVRIRYIRQTLSFTSCPPCPALPLGVVQLSAHPSLGARSSSRRRGRWRGTFHFPLVTLHEAENKCTEQDKSEDVNIMAYPCVVPTANHPGTGGICSGALPPPLENGFSCPSARRSMFSSSSSHSLLRRINGRGLLLTRNMIGFFYPLALGAAGSAASARWRRDRNDATLPLANAACRLSPTCHPMPQTPAI